MSMLQIHCAACQSALQVRAELAGRQGKCPKCGAAVAVPADAASTCVRAPSSINQAGALPLGRATAPDMLAEVARRKKSAVMIVFETPAGSDYQIAQSAGANVRCYRSPEMSDKQMMAVLRDVGRMGQGAPNARGGVQLEGEGGPEPFELKGDRLGLTLEDFKAKYGRRVGAFHLPWCSDQSPGKAVEELHTENWFDGAGLVNARTVLPSESDVPTVAGVKTELLLYQFVDGRLYRITALFETDEYHHVREALLAKHGEPTGEKQAPVAYSWDNGVSAIQLIRGAIRPPKASVLHMVHHGLMKVAEGRTPQRSSDL